MQDRRRSGRYRYATAWAYRFGISGRHNPQYLVGVYATIAAKVEFADLSAVDAVGELAERGGNVVAHEDPGCARLHLGVVRLLAVV